MGLELDPILADSSLVRWLAQQTATPEQVIQEELEVAAARRAFVVEKLLDAGLSESAVLDVTMRLTGISRRDALELIQAHSLARGRRLEAESGIYRKDDSSPTVGEISEA